MNGLFNGVQHWATYPKKRGVSMEKSKGGRKKNPDRLSQPNQNTIQ